MKNSIQKKILPYKNLWLLFHTQFAATCKKKYGGMYCYGFPTEKSAQLFEIIERDSERGKELSNCMRFKLDTKRSVRKGFLWVLYDLCNGEAHGGHDCKEGGGYIWVFDHYKDAQKHYLRHRDTESFAELTKPFRYVMARK